jgi:hypothetical protein
MRISAAFPSTYLKAADLQGRTVPVAIDRVELEEIGGEHKPILYFQGKDKGLVLNKTNANNIAAVYGDDTDDWIGGGIQLFPTMVDFQGRSVEAIRVRVAPRKAASAPQPRPAPAPQNGGHADLDDEIPF